MESVVSKGPKAFLASERTIRRYPFFNKRRIVINLNRQFFFLTKKAVSWEEQIYILRKAKSLFSGRKTSKKGFSKSRSQNKKGIINLGFVVKKINYKNNLFSKNSNLWVRGYSKHISLLLVAVIVLAGNLLTKEPKVLGQSLSGGETSEVIAQPPQKTVDLVNTIKVVSVFTPTLSENAKEIAPKITEEISIALASDNFLVKPHVLGIKTAHASSSTTRWYTTHVVQNGESLGSIANRYGVGTATLLGANNISDADIIKPGQTLRIPKEEGVMHIVARNESLIGIVRYYEGDLAQTVKANNMAGVKDRTIYVGQKIFVVDGKKPRPTYIAQNDTSSSSSSGVSSAWRPAYSGSGNHFPYGYCTWYVASKRYVPWHGNANQWLWNARAMGYSTGRTPQVGAIMVTNESWYGHVAYVEAVNGNTVTISEMNYAGWGRTNYRTLSAWYGQYIY